MDLGARFKLLEKIGTGSFATVYRARDNELGREVAIKRIHEQYLDDPKQLERYWREAQLLASLQHPNIVTIFDIDRDHGCLILELMQSNLAERMQGRQMDLRSLKTTVAHSLRALKYLHARGIIHGDIKPSNMMIDSRRRIKIGDFGLARRVSDEDGSLLKGTTKYMAPEVVSEEFGEIGPASDLYSLGFAAYELMCGPNFESLFPGLSAFGRNPQVAWMMWHAAPDRRLPEIDRVLQGVPEDLKRVIQRLTDKDQTRRYQTAQDALDDLQVDLKVVRGEQLVEDEAETPEADPGRKRRLLIAGAACALSLVLSLVLLFSDGEVGPPTEDGPLVRVVSQVYPDSNELKVEDLERTFAEKISLGENPRIRLTNTGRNIILEELQPGDRIEIEYETTDTGGQIMYVYASRPVVDEGQIKELDISDRRLVVAVESGASRDDLLLRVPDGATLQLNEDTSARLDELNVGDVVTVTHLPELRGTDGRLLHSLQARRTIERTGFLESIDVDNRTLKIRFGRDSSAATRMALADDARVLLAEPGQDDKPLDLQDLRPEDRVRLLYDTKVHEVRVTRSEQRWQGILLQMDPEAQTLHVQLKDSQRTFHYNEDTEFTVNLERATALELREADRVSVTGKPIDDRDVARAVDATRPVRDDRWAVIIATQEFEDEFLTPRPFALRNANLVRDALVNRYAMRPNNVLFLRNAEHDRIKDQLKEFLTHPARPSQLIVYISAPAYLSENRLAFVAGSDFQFDDMSATGVSLDGILNQIEGCAAADKLLILDCARAGVSADLQRQPSDLALIESVVEAGRTPQSTSIIAGSRDAERGRDLDGAGHGLFAHWLAEAFRGAADTDRDLEITARELATFLEREVPQSGSGDSQQHPTLIAPN